MQILTIYMKCQSPFYEKNKKNIIDLSSAEFAHEVIWYVRRTWMHKNFMVCELIFMVIYYSILMIMLQAVLSALLTFTYSADAGWFGETKVSVSYVTDAPN